MFSLRFFLLVFVKLEVIFGYVQQLIILSLLYKFNIKLELELVPAFSCIVHWFTSEVGMSFGLFMCVCFLIK